MEIYFEDVFKYIHPGLLGKIELKAYSNHRISEFNVVSDFSEQKELKCYQFSIHFKGLEQLKNIPTVSWVMSLGVVNSGILFKKVIKPDFYLINLFNQLVEEIMSRDTGYQCIVQSLNIQMLISLLRIINNNFKEGKGDRYFHKIEAEKTLEYFANHYRKNLFESDIIRDYNYTHYYSTEDNYEEKMNIIKNSKTKLDKNMFIYSNISNQKLLFEIKFKNNIYIIISSYEKEKSI